MFLNAACASNGESAVAGADEGDDEEGEPWEGVTEEIEHGGLDGEEDDDDGEEILDNEPDDVDSMLADEEDDDGI
jgi:hypothetical protein